MSTANIAETPDLLAILESISSKLAYPTTPPVSRKRKSVSFHPSVQVVARKKQCTKVRVFQQQPVHYNILFFQLQQFAEFSSVGFTSIIDSRHMLAVVDQIEGIIRNFLRYATNQNQSRFSWFKCKKLLGVKGLLPLHFHPFILKSVVLSIANYCAIGQLTGTGSLHTMLEGCVVRIPNIKSTSMSIRGSFNKLVPQIASVFVVSVDSTSPDSNGGPRFLANFVRYLPLIRHFYDYTHGYIPVYSDCRSFHRQITSAEIKLLNRYIELYTDIMFKRVTKTESEMDSPDLTAHILKVISQFKVQVPIVCSALVWTQPSLRPCSWLYWDSRTPMFYTKNKTRTPYIHVEASLHPSSTGKLTKSMFNNRKLELQNLKVNQRRKFNTPDGGLEQQWVSDSMAGKTKFNCTDRYRDIPCGYMTKRMLGVDCNDKSLTRWDTL
jgi:hypothetical protein